MALTDAQEKEVGTLRILATIVVSWLVVLAILSIAIEVRLLCASTGECPANPVILLCIVGGTLGSCVSALISAADRISLGWELSGPVKVPPVADTNGKPDRFVRGMVPFFLVRPFLGSAMGLVVYAGITGGYLIAVQNPGRAGFSREGLLFLAILVGLFAKTFIEKLRVMFDALFGKK